MSSSNESSSEDEANDKLVPATSYVPSTQYKSWKQDAEERGISISIFIGMMVEAGRRNIELEENRSFDEIHDLRNALQEARDERDQAFQKLRQQQNQEFTTGLGRIKDLIIDEPGHDRAAITNFVAENTALFVEDYLENLDSTDFQFRNGGWYPPNAVGDAE